MFKKKNLSLVSQGLRYKLRISFYLMSVLPLLVCIYVVSNYILPYLGFKLDIILSVLVSIFIAVSGFYVIKDVFKRILSVTSEAKLIAAGDINRRVEITISDEVSDLGEALNQLTQCIRNNMDELKNYSEKTSEINVEIQKRILVLSSLLQISSLIAQGTKLEDIFKLILEKSRLLANSESAYLCYRDEDQETFYTKVAEGINAEHILKIKVEPKDDVFGKLIHTNKPLILDKENVLPDNLSTDFYKKFKLKNTLALPVFLKRRVIGIFGIGNNQEPFSYKKDDIELLDILSKQLAIAVENDKLIHQLEKLEIKDTLTGSYNEAFIHNCLQEEIKRAIMYQRPCAFILLDIDNFQKFRSNFGSLQAEAALKKIASLIKDSVTEIDRVARTGDNEFAIVLPEKNKLKAKKIAEEIKKNIESSFIKEDVNKKLTLSIGVSENPLDGIDDKELINKAKDALSRAKTQGKDRIVS